MAANYNTPGRAKALGVRLRSARLSSSFTMEMLWAETGISHSQISRIESGEFKGPSRNVQILCEYFGIDWSDQPSPTGTPELVARLHRVAAASPHWANVVNAFVDAIEAAQATESQGL